jgi:cytochrome c oxidase subunit 4
MTAHVTAAEEHAHGHPTPGTYTKVGLVLFILTALEVALYEITFGEHAGALGDLRMVFVPALLTLSFAKFALVAMFYMHLKQDHRLFAGVFVFPLTIAAIVILALAALLAYHMAFAKSGA